MNYDNMVCIVIKSIQVAALTRKRNVKIGSAIHHNGRPPHLRTSTMIVCVPTEKGRPLETAYAELTHTESTGDGDQEDDGKCILNKHKPNQCTPLPKKKVLIESSTHSKGIKVEIKAIYFESLTTQAYIQSLLK